MSTALIDAVEIRRFLELISSHATKLVNGAKSSGFLNLCRISPLDSDKVVTSRFTVDDAEHMIEAALCDAERNNVYIEGRTVRPGLPASSRGDLKDTQCVFALVIDSDADKGKAGQINVRPSLVVETSPGNYHFWFLLSDAISAEQAKVIGDVACAPAPVLPLTQECRVNLSGWPARQTFRIRRNRREAVAQWKRRALSTGAAISGSLTNYSRPFRRGRRLQIRHRVRRRQQPRLRLLCLGSPTNRPCPRIYSPIFGTAAPAAATTSRDRGYSRARCAN